MTIEKDLERLKALYSDYISISKECIAMNRISPDNLEKMNLIIIKLNFYRAVYKNKYHTKIHSDLLRYILNEDPSAQELISEFVYFSSQLKQLDGYQYLNL
mgnify:CR=1 FL=1